MLGLLEKARQLRDSLALTRGIGRICLRPGFRYLAAGTKGDSSGDRAARHGKPHPGEPRGIRREGGKAWGSLPDSVNVLAVVVLAAGLALFYFLFQRGETQAASGDTTTITAEGKLIEEVKKESDAKLQEKNQQINQIQGQLAIWTSRTGSPDQHGRQGPGKRESAACVHERRA